MEPQVRGCYNAPSISGCLARVMEQLRSGARRLGLDLGAAQLQHLHRYAEELEVWNARLNLTAITDPSEVEVRHFLDSVSVVLGLPDGAQFRGSLVDVGSGGGFPGLPLKLALPAMHLALVESVGKKARFLCHLVQVLRLEDTPVYDARAEELAQRPELRETFDVAVARAVGELSSLAELCLPFCRVGGRFIAQKRADSWQEVQAAWGALEALGGGPPELVEVPLGELPGAVLVVVQKVRPTPERYPRRAGMPAKRPL